MPHQDRSHLGVAYPLGVHLRMKLPRQPGILSALAGRNLVAHWLPRAARAVARWIVIAPALFGGLICRAESRVDFNRDIRPIFSNNCYKCHGPDAAERKGGNGGLRLDTADGAFQDLGGYAAIVPGKPQESELLRRIRSTDAAERMPPPETGKTLTETEIALLENWIASGAPYSEHWSYRPVIRPSLLAVDRQQWPRNAVDFFVLARLEQEAMQPSPEAEPEALIRRVALDLTGLPPTADEVEAFLADQRPDAYERLVDRLLASPAFGEHWARLWLDLARYADSAGYADDPPRTIWAYRDYVIRAFNRNLPFDQFTIEQIAGDLLPNPIEEQLIATAMHRNTLTNNEGGTNDEEFRNVAIVDRVNTTLAVWMGTTINCAQCHNHKYDPISQKEFFQIFAIFNNTADADRRDESPLLEVWTQEQKAEKARLLEELNSLKTQTPLQDSDRARLEELEKQLASIKPFTTVPIMQELPEAQRRVTRIQRRGNFLDLDEPVEAGVPSVFAFRHFDRPPNRLDLAQWLVDPRNPLTARVMANRFWEQIFGTGLVRTSEEFGTQGELPSHPELLDWLSAELVDNGWDIKRFLRLLVTSATYRQSSRVTDELVERDPDNRLLARGPRFRLSAEMIRDQALLVSDLLSRKMYGEPVRPVQPKLGVNAAFGSGIDWQPSPGEDQYRRGIYTTWRRSNPYPSMVTFDAPNREVCTIRRDRTNTPLQALVTLNDPVYVEAAQALARRMMEEASRPEGRAAAGFRRCLARKPNQRELARLLGLYESAKHRLAGAPEQARLLAGSPGGQAAEDEDSVEVAAWTVVANVLLNLDEFLMKR